MYRILNMSGTYYGVEFDELNKDEVEEIETFVNEGTPVILVEDINDISLLGIYSNIIMI